jgi:hypothetical protein
MPSRRVLPSVRFLSRWPAHGDRGHAAGHGERGRRAEAGRVAGLSRQPRGGDRIDAGDRLQDPVFDAKDALDPSGESVDLPA